MILRGEDRSMILRGELRVVFSGVVDPVAERELRASDALRRRLPDRRRATPLFNSPPRPECPGWAGVCEDAKEV